MCVYLRVIKSWNNRIVRLRAAVFIRVAKYKRVGNFPEGKVFVELQIPRNLKLVFHRISSNCKLMIFLRV